MDRVVIVASDLLFQSRITAAVQAAGAASVVCDVAMAGATLAEGPALLVIDLHERDVDAPGLISQAKATGARVLAFGRHTQPNVLRAARAAGADLVVPRSQLAEELPQLLDMLLSAGPMGA